jgi:hypothetical protein
MRGCLLRANVRYALSAVILANVSLRTKGRRSADHILDARELLNGAWPIPGIARVATWTAVSVVFSQDYFRTFPQYKARARALERSTQWSPIDGSMCMLILPLR